MAEDRLNPVLDFQELLSSIAGEPTDKSEIVRHCSVKEIYHWTEPLLEEDRPRLSGLPRKRFELEWRQTETVQVLGEAENERLLGGWLAEDAVIHWIRGMGCNGSSTPANLIYSSLSRPRDRADSSDRHRYAPL